MSTCLFYELNSLTDKACRLPTLTSLNYTKEHIPRAPMDGFEIAQILKRASAEPVSSRVQSCGGKAEKRVTQLCKKN